MLRVVHAVSRAVADPHLRDARADRLHVASVAEREPADAGIDARLGFPVPEAVEPSLVRRGLQDLQHGASVYHTIQPCKCIRTGSTP